MIEEIKTINIQRYSVYDQIEARASGWLCTSISADWWPRTTV